MSRCELVLAQAMLFVQLMLTGQLMLPPPFTGNSTEQEERKHNHTSANAPQSAALSSPMQYPLAEAPWLAPVSIQRFA